MISLGLKVAGDTDVQFRIEHFLYLTIDNDLAILALIKEVIFPTSGLVFWYVQEIEANDSSNKMDSYV